MWLLLLFCLGLYLFLAGYFHVSDVDVGYHMRTAEHILNGGGIPSVNTFSQTIPQHPWLLHQWLGTLLFYIPYGVGGVEALVAFKAVLGAIVMLLVWWSARRQTVKCSLWPFWVVTAGVLVARVRFFERSDLLSALFCAVLFLADDRFRLGRWWQWFGLPLLFACWANVHAGCIYGLVLMAAWWGADVVAWLCGRYQVRFVSGGDGASACSGSAGDLCIRPVGMALAVAVACLSVQVINPNGCKVLLFPVSQFASPFWQSIIAEYQPPALVSYKMFYGLLACLVVLQLLTIRTVNVRLLAGSAVFGYLACTSQRSMLFFCITALPHAASMLDRLFADPVAVQRPARVLLLPAAWLAICVGVFIPDRTFLFGPGFYHPYYPLEVYEFMRRHVPSQPVFNDMRFGGSMLWWLYPKFKPYIDGRGDAYPEEFWKKDYFPVVAVEKGWHEVLEKYGVNSALIMVSGNTGEEGLAMTLRRSGDWALVAFNDDVLLFLKRSQLNRVVIERYEYRHIWPGDRTLGAINGEATRAAASVEAARALALSPYSLFARTAAARACFLAGEYGEAARLLASVVRRAQVNENYFRDYGYALFRTGQWAESDAVFSGMIERRQLPGFAHFMRHHIALRNDDLVKARASILAAIESEPGNNNYREALKLLDLQPAIR